MLKPQKGSYQGPKCALRIDFVSHKGLPQKMSKFEARRNHKRPDPVTDPGGGRSPVAAGFPEVRGTRGRYQKESHSLLTPVGSADLFLILLLFLFLIIV